MSKGKMIEAYKKTEEEWAYYGLKEKAQKIKEHLNMLEVNTPEEQACIDNQILMIEVLDPKELSSLLESIHSMIMENTMRIIDSMED